MMMLSDIAIWPLKEGKEEADTDKDRPRIVAELLAKVQEQQEVEENGKCCCPDMPGSAAGGGEERRGGPQEEQRQKGLFQQWLKQHGNCLYPSREQKEKLAQQIGTSYVKINKLLANHRRRQHKQKAQQMIATADKENRSCLSEGEKIEQTIEDIWHQVTGGNGQEGLSRRRDWTATGLEMEGAGGGGGPARLTSPSHAQQQQQQSMAFQPPPTPAFQHFPPGATPFGIGMDWLQLLAAARQPSFQQSGPPPPPSASASQMPMAALPSTALAQSSRPLAAQPHSFGPGPPQANVNCQQRQTHCQSQQQQPNPAVPNPLLLAALAQAHQQQQQFVQQQQFALVKAAIEKEILELLNAAKGQQQQQNMAILAQRHQLLVQLGQMQHEQVPQAQSSLAIGQQPSQGPGNDGVPTSLFLSPPLTLSPASSAANGSCGSPPFSVSSESQVPSREEDDFPLDLDLVEKQIAAQHNRLSAAEAEAVAVLAGLAAAGGVGR